MSSLSITWTATQPNSLIKDFSSVELKRMWKQSSTELDPATGRKSRFRGVRLSDVIDRALDGMSSDRKAQIDLIVLKNAQGAEALVPRFFSDRVLLALWKNGKPMAGIESVPMTHVMSRSDSLPLRTYFVTDVTDIELGNYRMRYGGVFLKNRTDPVAMRGEKVFMQDCLSCHDSQPGIDKARNWIGTHPKVNGTPKLSILEKHALRSYLDAYRAEHVAATAAAK